MCIQQCLQKTKQKKKFLYSASIFKDIHKFTKSKLELGVHFHFLVLVFILIIGHNIPPSY